jgi:proteic killer suppression protein
LKEAEVIKSFKHKGLKAFFEDGSLRGIQAKHRDRLAMILDVLDAMTCIDDIRLPGLNLHLLNPKQERIYAVKVSGNWRVTFKFENSDVHIVNYLDYH